MTVRRAAVLVHRYLGLAAAAVLFVTGITGGILALQPDYDVWLHRAVRRVAVGPSRLAEQALLDIAKARTTRDGAITIEAVSFGGPSASNAYTLSDGALVFVDPYTGAILGTRDQPTRLDRFLAASRELHVRLMAGLTGEWAVDVGAIIALFLSLTGLMIWWRRKTVTVSRRSPWQKIVFDLHSATGAYTLVFVTLMTVTGLFIAFESALQFVTRSAPVIAPAMPHSAVPAGDRAHRASVDDLLAAAGRALPAASTLGILLPATPRSSVRVLKAGARGYGRSTVFLDQYSAAVLRVDDYDASDRAERAHTVNAALHMGTMFGFAGRLALSLSSFALALLAATGVVQWLKRWRP